MPDRSTLPAGMRALAVPLAMLCLSAAHSAPAARFCVVGPAAFGCVDQRVIAQLTEFRGDVDALRRDIAGSLQSGSCRMFREGEFVFADTDAGPWRSVRRAGDDVSYWMPSAWARPADECAVFASPRSVERRLGLAALAAPTMPELSFAPATVADPARNTVLHRCEIKAVMTDAEIAACRNGRR